MPFTLICLQFWHPEALRKNVIVPLEHEVNQDSVKSAKILLVHIDGRNCEIGIAMCTTWLFEHVGLGKRAAL